MSLINEALKKAQRLRHDDPADSSASAGAGGGGIAKRGKARSANTMVLIGSGAIVLVVLSVVFTVYLVNRPSKSLARVDSAAVSPVVEKTTPAGPGAESPAPIAITPTLTGPKPTTPAEPTQIQPAAPAEPTVASTPSLTPDSSTPTAKTVPRPSAAAMPDERVTAFVEGVRVTGIRSSGAESRVLMNERVYRVNDVVERTLGVRLTTVAVDSLTFSDPNGIIYVKKF